MIAPPETTITTPPPPTVDSAALHAELDDLFDQVWVDATRAGAGQRAEEILGLSGLPRNLLADAAAIAANVQQDQGNLNRACELMRQARNRMPSRDSYGKSLVQWGCSP